jgi:hypothetical protein
MTETKTPKWNTGHFPTGTYVEAETYDKFSFTVKGISRNGADSFILHTDIPSEHNSDGYKCINIFHVTKIIHRGAGKIDVRTGKENFIKTFLDEQKFNDSFLKHKSQYLSILGMNGVVMFVCKKYETPEMMVDYDKLTNKLYKQGVFKITKLFEEESSFKFYKFSCNKKRLNKSIKRLLNKCLISVKDKSKQEEWSDSDFE